MSGEPEKSRRRSSRLEFHFLAIQISDGPVTAAVVANARTAPTVCDVMLEIFPHQPKSGDCPYIALDATRGRRTQTLSGIPTTIHRSLVHAASRTRRIKTGT